MAAISIINKNYKEKSMRKFFMTFFAMTLLSLITLTFVSCGDKKESNTAPSLNNNNGSKITPVSATAPTSANANVTVTTLNVSGMTCSRCVQAITNALRKNPDIKNVAVDVRGGIVTVTHDPKVAEAEIRRIIIEDAGYSVGGSR